MTEEQTLATAIEQRGAYAAWELMDDEVRREAAAALWENADRESRMALELALAKELKFRPQSVRRLPAAKVAGRLVKLAEDLGERVLFQYLFHLHMAGRRSLLAEFLDAVKLPHDDGVLDLDDDTQPPDEATVQAAADKLIAAHGTTALVYFATLKVADADFWSGLDEVLEGFDEKGAARKKTETTAKASSKTAASAKKKPAKKAAATKKATTTPKKTSQSKRTQGKASSSRTAPSKVTKKTSKGKTTNK